MTFRNCVCAVLTAMCWSIVQPADSLAQERNPTDGWTVPSVGASATYFSQSVPQNIPTFEDVFRGSGGSVSGFSGLRWRRTGKQSFLMFDASGVYGARVQQGHEKNWNEALGLSAMRHVGRRWHFGASTGHSIANFDEALFTTTTLGRIAAVRTTFPNLASGVLQHNSGDPTLDTVDAFRPDTNTARFLFGRRVENEYVDGTMGYSTSPRFGIDFTAGGSRIAHLNDGYDLPDTLSPSVASVYGNISASYVPRRRTELNLGATYSRSGSVYGYYEGIGTFAGLQQTFRRHWFVEGRLGGGSTTGAAAHTELLYGFGVGFKTATHSIIGAFGRDLTQMYLSALGPASAYFQSSGVSWYWSPRRAQWWAQSGFSQYRDQPPGHIEAPTSWDASATLGRVLGRSYVLSFSYTMARTGARRYIFEGRHYQLHETGARVSFAWNPFARQGLR